jgi:hypothetical protein
MSTLSRTATAKLAAEIAANAPTPEWDSVPELKRWKEPIALKGGEKKTLTFDQLVTKYKDIDAEIKYREGIKDTIKTAIEAAMLLSEQEKVSCEGYGVSLVTREGSKKIVAEKLLANGVSPDVIAKSIEVGKSSTYVSIRPEKEK